MAKSRSNRRRPTDTEGVKLRLIGVVAVLLSIALVVGLALGLPKVVDSINSSKRSGRRPTDTEGVKLRLIGVVAVLLSIALVVGLALGLPKVVDSINSSKRSGNVAPSNPSSSVSVVSDFPDEAGKSALDWYLKLISKLDKAGLPEDFFNDNASTDILNDFANGNYERMPKEVQDSLWFSDDTKGDDRLVDYPTMKAAALTSIIMSWQLHGKAVEADKTFKPDLKGSDDTKGDDRLVDYPTMKAAALTSIIMSWQLHGKAVEADKTFKPDLKGVMVDEARGQVSFPMETVCGLPASYVIVIDWTGSEWKVDGDITGAQVASQVRMNQLSEKYQDIQKDQKSSGSNK